MLLTSLLTLALSAGTPASDTLRADADIRNVALRHAPQVRACYEAQGLRLNPSLSGAVEVELVVAPTGRVDSAYVASSSLAGPGKREVETCIVTAARQWRFDRGPYRPEIVVYPFTLVKERESRAVVSRGA